MNHLRLTPSRTASNDLYLENGLIAFRLGLWVSNREIASLHVNSGAPGLQAPSNLREFQDSNSRPGSSEPIPEGEYKVGPPEFATPNSYSGSWGAGLGPVWFDLPPKRKGNRSAFGIHLDENRAFAPGSAGCVVTRTLEDLKTIVKWYDQYKFQELIVDLGLGSIQKPSLPSPPVQPKPPAAPGFKIDINDKGSTLSVSETILPGSYQIFSNSPSWTGKLVRKDD